MFHVKHIFLSDAERCTIKLFHVKQWRYHKGENQWVE